MPCANLSDDELWRGIVQNTDAMSLLFEEHRELDAGTEPNKRADLMRSHLERASQLLREYHEHTAELRRRYPLAAAR
jgi:hypothetical protein